MTYIVIYTGSVFFMLSIVFKVFKHVYMNMLPKYLFLRHWVTLGSLRWHDSSATTAVKIKAFIPCNDSKENRLVEKQLVDNLSNV